jgi:integrase
MARAVAEQMEREAYSGNVPVAVKQNEIVSEYAGDFLKYINATRLSMKTKAYYANGIRLLMEAGIGPLKLNAITTETVETLSVPGSGSNMNCALRALGRMLRRAGKAGLIRVVPEIPLAEENQRERLVQPEEEKLILDNASPNLHDLYLIVLDAGTRPGEAVNLAWEHVDLVRGVVLVNRGKTGMKARRHLPISDRVRSMLVERAKVSTCKWVFPSPFKSTVGQPMKVESFTAKFGRLKVKLGLPKELVLYSARHTFATDFMDATGDINQTSRMIGHTNLKTTQRYLHPKVAELGTIMDARNAARKASLASGHVFGHVLENLQ